MNLSDESPKNPTDGFENPIKSGKIDTLRTLKIILKAEISLNKLAPNFFKKEPIQLGYLMNHQHFNLHLFKRNHSKKNLLIYCLQSGKKINSQGINWFSKLASLSLSFSYETKIYK